MKKAYCKKDEIIKLLDRRPLKYIVEQMNERGYEIEYKNFLQLINNKSNFMLVYAFGIAEVLNVKIEDIFYVK